MIDPIRTEESTILIVDDQPVFRFGVRQILTLDSRAWRILECSNESEALTAIKDQNIDFLFMEFKPGEGNRLELLAHAKRDYPDLLVMVIGTGGIHPEVHKLNQLGVDAFLPKSCRIEDIIEGLNAISAGKTYFLYSSLTGDKQPPTHSKSYPITKREREILKLIFKEHTNPEIAELLSISRRTVDTHRKNLLKKMKVRNTAGLIRHALRSGILQLSD